MKVLIGCEESGVVRDAFIKRGHDAISCDLQETRSPGPHIIGDVVDAVTLTDWDLVILHPPCTALALSGNRWYGKGMPRHRERIKAIKWTLELWEKARRNSNKVVLENPASVIFAHLKDADGNMYVQYIHPWQFGHGETKKTGLAIHNLLPLEPTNIVDGREARVHRMPPGPNRARDRSVTYQGIADAMAEQWG